MTWTRKTSRPGELSRGVLSKNATIAYLSGDSLIAVFRNTPAHRMVPFWFVVVQWMSMIDVFGVRSAVGSKSRSAPPLYAGMQSASDAGVPSLEQMPRPYDPLMTFVISSICASQESTGWCEQPATRTIRKSERVRASGVRIAVLMPQPENKKVSGEGFSGGGGANPLVVLILVACPRASCAA